MNFCSACGGKISQRIPVGDDRVRFVCESCNEVFYENPKIVAGVIPMWKGRILLCRRAIEPAFGKWTLPAGYLENGETIAQCAVRETVEEAGASLNGLIPYAVLNLPDINQVYFMYRAEVKDGVFKAGKESLEVDFFELEDIPWSNLSFRSIRKVLELYVQDRKSRAFPKVTFHDVVV